MNKYEQLIEHIINDESDKASALFHTIVVEQSRDIYESLVDEEDLAEVGGNQVEELANEIVDDEEGLNEEEIEGELDDEMEADFDNEAEDDDSEDELEDRVVDLETALDELKAEFDELMANEENEEENFPGIHDAEEDSDFDADEEMDFDDESDESELVREYVEKVASPSKTEGGEVGKGGTATVNKQSIVAKKNDMGGTAANIANGGTENSKPAKKPQEMNSRNINVPGGNAGKTAYKSKVSAKSSEGETTDGKMSVDSKSVIGKKAR